VVIDTDVYGADLVPGSALGARYEPLIVGRPAFISFQTAAGLRYGAMLRGWGRARMLKLDTRINTAEIAHTGSRPDRRVRTPPQSVAIAIASRSSRGSCDVALVESRVRLSRISGAGARGWGVPGQCGWWGYS